MTSFPSIGFGVATAAVSFGAHRVVLVWAERSFPALVAKRRAILAACAVLAACPWLARLVTTRTQNPVTDLLFAASLAELLVVLAALGPLLVLMGWSSVSRRRKEERETANAALAPPAAPAIKVTRRDAIETIGGATLLGATSAAFGWGATIGRHDYEVCEVPVRIRGLPKELDGYVIAQISDIHTGLFVGERELREGTERIRKLRPDLVVATGDLVDFDAGQAPLLARTLADFAPRDGVFAILGNHDYYAGHEAVSAAIRAAGVTLLVNEARVIRGGFGLVGVDDAWSQPYGGPGPNLNLAMASLPEDAPRILLAHQPNGFDHSAGRVALQLSGHTHGGQIFPANLLMRGHVAGRYERRGSTLYVNRGFGVAGPPARVGIPPEITKIILVAA
jgi:predicted MPP superfamily phosphohydrolase